MTQEAEFERVVKEAVPALGRQDVPVNAAGIIANGTIENMALSVQDRLFAVNVRGPSYLMQRAMDHPIQSKGNVVNVSSVDGICAFPRVLAYCSSKAALDQLTRCAALQVAAKGIRAIVSGAIDSRFTRSSRCV